MFLVLTWISHQCSLFQAK